jgi:putative ABC transport system substrate-binding protein
VGLGGLGLLAGCGRWPGSVPPPAKVPRLGFLGPGDAASSSGHRQAFLEELYKLGWAEGQNITIQYRYAEGHTESLPALAADLVRQKVDIFIAPTSPVAIAAHQATTEIPIVFTDVGDPVSVGLVASLARPGGNVTGISTIAPRLSAKRLQLLKDAVPTISRVGGLWTPRNPANAREWSDAQASSKVLGVELESFPITGPEEITGVFDGVVHRGVDSLFVLSGPVIGSRRGQVVDLATQHGLPGVYPGSEFAVAGGLMSYGFGARARFGRVAYYVDRILKGTKPADLPVEQPREFDFVINIRTAQALGLTIPQHVLLQATEIIQ